MKTWQVAAVVAGIVGVGWLLFRRGGQFAAVPGSSSSPSTSSGPPSSYNPLPGAQTTSPTSLADAVAALFSGANSGTLSSTDAAAAQMSIIDAARAAGLPIATGPATETRTGRGHF